MKEEEKELTKRFTLKDMQKLIPRSPFSTLKRVLKELIS
jgi:hypothetical protein